MTAMIYKILVLVLYGHNRIGGGCSESMKVTFAITLYAMQLHGNMHPLQIVGVLFLKVDPHIIDE